MLWVNDGGAISAAVEGVNSDGDVDGRREEGVDVSEPRVVRRGAIDE